MPTPTELIDEAMRLLRGQDEPKLILGPDRRSRSDVLAKTKSSPYTYRVVVNRKWEEDKLTFTARSTSTYPNTNEGRTALVVYLRRLLNVERGGYQALKAKAEKAGIQILEPRIDRRHRVRDRVDKRNKINGARVGRKAAK